MQTYLLLWFSCSRNHSDKQQNDHSQREVLAESAAEASLYVDVPKCFWCLKHLRLKVAAQLSLPSPLLSLSRRGISINALQPMITFNTSLFYRGCLSNEKFLSFSSHTSLSVRSHLMWTWCEQLITSHSWITSRTKSTSLCSLRSFACFIVPAEEAICTDQKLRILLFRIFEVSLAQILTNLGLFRSVSSPNFSSHKRCNAVEFVKQLRFEDVKQSKGQMTRSWVSCWLSNSSLNAARMKRKCLMQDVLFFFKHTELCVAVYHFFDRIHLFLWPTRPKALRFVPSSWTLMQVFPAMDVKWVEKSTTGETRRPGTSQETVGFFPNWSLGCRVQSSVSCGLTHKNNQSFYQCPVRMRVRCPWVLASVESANLPTFSALVDFLSVKTQVSRLQI